METSYHYGGSISTTVITDLWNTALRSAPIQLLAPLHFAQALEKEFEANLVQRDDNQSLPIRWLMDDGSCTRDRKYGEEYGGTPLVVGVRAQQMSASTILGKHTVPGVQPIDKAFGPDTAYMRSLAQQLKIELEEPGTNTLAAGAQASDYLMNLAGHIDASRNAPASLDAGIRAEFERAVLLKAPGANVDRATDGSYADPHIDGRWVGWQEHAEHVRSLCGEPAAWLHILPGKRAGQDAQIWWVFREEALARKEMDVRGGLVLPLYAGHTIVSQLESLLVELLNNFARDSVEGAASVLDYHRSTAALQNYFGAMLPPEECSVSAMRNQVEQSVIAWWLDKKPFGWSMNEHLDEPDHFCTREEKPLALLARELYRQKNRDRNEE